MSVAADLSWVIAAAGVVLGTATLFVFRRPAPAVHVLLDLLLAAGLLRLSTDLAWPAIAVTAVVVVLRRLLTRGLVATPGGAPARSPTRP